MQTILFCNLLFVTTPPRKVTTKLVNARITTRYLRSPVAAGVVEAFSKASDSCIIKPVYVSWFTINLRYVKVNQNQTRFVDDHVLSTGVQTKVCHVCSSEVLVKARCLAHNIFK